MQGFAMQRHRLWLVISPSLLLPQTFSEQLVFGYHLADVLLDVLGFILYGDLDAHQALSILFLADVQSLDIGLGVEAFVHCEEFAGLHICTLHLLLCTAYYAGYLMTGALMAWILFFPLSWLFRTCLTPWWYFDVAVLLASSSWFPCDCGIPRYI